MQTYVALLRGINVGGNSKVEMSKLKSVMEELGYIHVSTYINSGNVIFSHVQQEPALLEKNIEIAVEQVFGFPIPVVVRSAHSIASLCAVIPKTWKNDDDMKTDVLFLREGFKSSSTLEKIKSNPDVDTMKYSHGAIVWNLDRKKYNKSGMRKFIGTLVYKNMTARNINTVRKLNELMNGEVKSEKSFKITGKKTHYL